MSKGLAVALLLGGLGAACAPENVQAGTTTITAATAPAPAPLNAHAIDTLTAARCMHEASCGSVGAMKHYATYDACVAQVRAQDANELATAGCSQPLDDEYLDTCLADIRADACETPLDALGRLSTCAAASLCRVRATAPTSPPAVAGGEGEGKGENDEGKGPPQEATAPEAQ